MGYTWKGSATRFNIPATLVLIKPRLYALLCALLLFTRSRHSALLSVLRRKPYQTTHHPTSLLVCLDIHSRTGPTEVNLSKCTRLTVRTESPRLMPWLKHQTGSNCRLNCIEKPWHDQLICGTPVSHLGLTHIGDQRKKESGLIHEAQ